jgi:hypothetical protein
MISKNKNTRCSGRTQKGEPCRAAATPGGLCFFHANPNKASELVFKLNQAGNETVLFSFAGANGEPDTPNGVIEDSKGNLYGTTFYGGDLSCGQNGYGCGVVFKLTP